MPDYRPPPIDDAEYSSKSTGGRNALIATVLVAVGGLVAWWMYRPPLPVSPETTVITSPLLPDGRPDYARVLNERFAKTVTPENNAALLLGRVEGTPSLNDKQLAEYRQLIGAPVPGEGEAWLRFDDIPEDPYLYLWLDHLAESTWTALEEHEQIAVQKFFDRNAAQLKLLDELAGKTGYYSMIWFSDETGAWTSTVTPELVEELAITLDLLSQQEISKRNGAGAAKASLTILRLGRLLAQQPDLRSQMTGLEIEKRGVASLSRLLNSRCLAREEIQELRTNIASLPESPDAAKMIDEVIRLYGLDLAMRMHRGRQYDVGTWEGYPVALNRGEDIRAILLSINKRYDGYRDMLAGGDSRAQGEFLREFISFMVVSQDGEFEFNPIMQPVYDFLGSEPTEHVRGDVAIAECSGQPFHIARLLQQGIRRDLLELGLSIAEFEQVHKAYPKSLDELVPEFLPSIPADPSSAQPLKYSVDESGFQIYSVGPNGEDDQGEDEYVFWTDSRSEDDVFFGEKMGIPEKDSIE